MCVVVVWVPITESYRVEIKKFVDAKAPLNMLKYKMQFKSEQNEIYIFFYGEIDTVIAEQKKFLEKSEYQVAVAEAIDPVQAFVFLFFEQITDIGVSSPRIFNLSLLMHTGVYICTHTCMPQMFITHEADDEAIVTAITNLQKLEGMPTHHQVGSHTVKKRFDAMLA